MNLNQLRFDEMNDLESWLYNYKSIKVGIENLKLEYEESRDISPGSADPGKETSVTNKFNSNVENSIINIEQLKNKVSFMESRMKKLDKALSSLNKEEYDVINNYYILGRHMYEFTHEVGTSERSCKRIKKRAIEKIRIATYGIQENLS